MRIRARLTDPGGSGVSLLRKTFVLGLGAGAARLLGAAILILLARLLGVARFGIFGYAMSVALLLEVAIDMGQSLHIGRLVSREPESGPSLFGDVLTNKTILSLVAALGTWAILSFSGTGHEEALTVAFMVVWGGFLSILDSERAVARALGLFAADSIVNSLESVGRLVGVVAAGLLGVGLAGFGAAFAVECGVAAIVFYFILARRARLWTDKPSLATAGRFLRDATPLGLAGIAFVGFYQIDQIFVRAFAGPEANGLYAAAARVVFAANSLAGLVVVAAYPELAQAYRDHALFRRRFASLLRIAAPVSAAVSLVTLVLAGPIVSILFGGAYAGTVPLLRILAPVVLLDSLVMSGVFAGNALGRERRVLAVIGVMLAANVAGNWLLVPHFGAYAAAWISTLGEGFAAAGLIAVSWDRIVPSAALEPAEAEEAAC